MCFIFVCPNLMMVDFDQTPSMNKDVILNILEEYVKAIEKQGPPIKFMIYETDNGIHAFLVSREGNTQDDTIKAMLQMRSDYMYVLHTMFRGFCIRVSPKIVDKSLAVKPKEVAMTQYIAKQCYQSVCELGSALPNEKMMNILNFKNDLIVYFLRMYDENYESLAKTFIKKEEISSILIRDVVYQIKMLMKK